MGIDADNIVDLYERHASAWAHARHQEGTLYERGWLDRFCAMIAAAGSVLDLGCGPGEPIAAYLVRQGFAITGIDSSRGMIAMFQARLPGQEAFVSDMRALALGRKFQGILAWDSFFHLDHGAQRRMLPVFRAHAAPRAPFMFTSGPSHGEAIGRLEGEPLYHASLDAQEYRQLLDEQGFDVVATVVKDPTCGGRTIWLTQLR
jgi:SAM-dependent methyltransferase